MVYFGNTNMQFTNKYYKLVTTIEIIDLFRIGDTQRGQRMELSFRYKILNRQLLEALAPILEPPLRKISQLLSFLFSHD